MLAAEPRRAPLNRDRVLRTAVTLADQVGIASVSMRRLSQELDVVPMALYKHVAHKEALLDGMIDVVVGEIDPPISDTDWKTAMRQRILSARRVLRRHPWAPAVFESRTTPTPVALAYLDSVIGLFRTGGFSLDLTHHVMHALGSRMWGFSQELYETTPGDGPDPATLREMAATYPYVTELAVAVSHDAESVVGGGCDDQVEFEFALDLMLDGFERLRVAAGSPR